MFVDLDNVGEPKPFQQAKHITEAAAPSSTQCIWWCGLNTLRESEETHSKASEARFHEFQILSWKESYHHQPQEQITRPSFAEDKSKALLMQTLNKQSGPNT